MGYLTADSTPQQKSIFDYLGLDDILTWAIEEQLVHLLDCFGVRWQQQCFEQ